VKLTLEIWEDADGFAMFSRGAEKRKELLLKPPCRLLHTYEAETLFAAYQTYYDLMGWGRMEFGRSGRPAFTEDDRPSNSDSNIR